MTLVGIMVGSGIWPKRFPQGMGSLLPGTPLLVWIYSLFTFYPNVQLMELGDEGPLGYYEHCSCSKISTVQAMLTSIITRGMSEVYDTIGVFIPHPSTARDYIRSCESSRTPY